MYLLRFTHGWHDEKVLLSDTDFFQKELPNKREIVISNDTMIETWDKAVQAYLDEDWDACIKGFQDLIYK